MGIPIEKKRNVALIGHGGAGKTTLAEALLFVAGVTTRMGAIEDGNTVSDFSPEEIRRRYSINSCVLPFDSNGHRINLIDCPGYLDFIGDSISALNVVDAAIIVVDGGAGVEPQTRQAWENCTNLELPRLIFISGLDKENASWAETLAACQQAFGRTVAPLVMTIGQQHQLRGVVNVLTRTAYIKDGDKIVSGDVPAEMQDAVEETRATLVESIVELDDALMERYMEDESIADEDLMAALQDGVRRGAFCPAVGGAAKALVGARNLLELIESALPHPGLRGAVAGEKPGGGREERQLTAEAAPCARVFKISTEGQLGELFWMRLYSGTIRPGDTLYNAVTSEGEKVPTLLVMRGKTREDMTQADAGDIVATVKLKYTAMGHTLATKDNQIVLPELDYPSAVAYEAVDVDDKNDLGGLRHGPAASGYRGRLRQGQGRRDHQVEETARPVSRDHHHAGCRPGQVQEADRWARQVRRRSRPAGAD